MKNDVIKCIGYECSQTPWEDNKGHFITEGKAKWFICEDCWIRLTTGKIVDKKRGFEEVLMDGKVVEQIPENWCPKKDGNELNLGDVK